VDVGERELELAALEAAEVGAEVELSDDQTKGVIIAQGEVWAVWLGGIARRPTSSSWRTLVLS
jgi:hypothetical protein